MTVIKTSLSLLNNVMQFCLQNKKTKIEFEALNNNKFKILPISDARIFNFAIEKLKENA